MELCGIPTSELNIDVSFRTRCIPERLILKSSVSGPNILEIKNQGRLFRLIYIFYLIIELNDQFTGLKNILVILFHRNCTNVNNLEYYYPKF